MTENIIKTTTVFSTVTRLGATFQNSKKSTGEG